MVALIAFAGTLAGSVGGILTSNKLVNHRLDQLELRLDRLPERMMVVETACDSNERRLRDLERLHPRGA